MHTEPGGGGAGGFTLAALAAGARAARRNARGRAVRIIAAEERAGRGGVGRIDRGGEARPSYLLHLYHKTFVARNVACFTKFSSMVGRLGHFSKPGLGLAYEVRTRPGLVPRGVVSSF